MSRQLRIKALIVLLVELFTLASLGGFLFRMQTDVAVEDQKSSLMDKIHQIPFLMEEAEETTASVRESYDSDCLSKAKTAAYIARNSAEYMETQECMRRLAEDLEVTNVLLIDRAGNNVVWAVEPMGDFTRDRFNQLRKAFGEESVSEPFTVSYGQTDRRYYAAAVDHNRAIVIEQDAAELEEMIRQTSSWESILGTLPMGNNGMIMAISNQDNTFLYHPDESLIGMDAIMEGVDISLLKNEACGWQTIRNERLYCGTAEIPQRHSYIVFAMPKEEISDSVNLVVIVVMAVFLIVMVLVASYGILMLTAVERKKIKVTERRFGPFAMDKNITVKLSAVAGTGLVVIIGFSFYLQTLYSVSAYTNINKAYVAELERELEESEGRSQALTELYNRRYLNKCQVATQILTYNPELKNRADLKELVKALDIENIFVFNENGEMVATDCATNRFVLSKDPGEQSYEFNRILSGVPYLIQEAQPDEATGRMYQYIGVATLDEDGGCNGFVQICVTPDKLQETLASTTVNSIMERIQASSGGLVFSVDENGSFLYHTNEKLVGRSALDRGLTEGNMRAGYSNYITLDGVTSLASVLHRDNETIFVAVPRSDMLRTRLPVVLFTAGASFLCLLIVVMVLDFQPGMIKRLPRAKRHADQQEDASHFETTLPDGSVKLTQSAASRWTGGEISWNEKTPEQQLGSIMRFLISAFALLICMGVLLKDRLFANSSVFVQVVSGQWQKGVNIFALTAACMAICVICVAAMLARQFLAMIAKATNARVATICRLLRSIVRYLAGIISIYFALNLLGVDTTTLLTSAGILSLVVGLGSQKLIGDILAGLFIIFEGEFRVGDIITIGDWRGTVTEIGVRTTKVERDGNVKIFSNSSVTGVINMTKRLSLAPVTLCIDYDESIERVEEILKNELPKIGKKIPKIQVGPYYVGVTAMGDSSVDLLVRAECMEKDRSRVLYALNRELKLLCDRYHINIPYPQVSVRFPETLNVQGAEDTALSGAQD